MAYIDNNKVVAESPAGSSIFDELVGKTSFAPNTSKESIMAFLVEEMNRKGFSEGEYLRRYPEAMLLRGGEPKAHEQIDAIIGHSYESDPDILGEHTTLLNYLAGAVSKPGSKDRYMHGIDGRELEKRMAEIESYSSKVDDSGTKRYTIPLLVPGSYPPKYEHESRSMQHWIEDYPLWINRSSINNP